MAIIGGDAEKTSNSRRAHNLSLSTDPGTEGGRGGEQMGVRERKRETASVFLWVFNTAWLWTLEYVRFEVCNTIIKDLFPNSMQ